MLRTFAGGRLFGSSSGAGKPVVLALHGWGRSHKDFYAVLRPGDGAGALDGLALDLPGFGATPPPLGAWGAADYAQCVAGVLDEMGVPVVVVGHSFGGRVAVHLAAARPDAVAALVLTGVPLVRASAARRPPAPYRLVRGLNRLGLVSDRRMEAARRRYGSADYAAAEGIMRQVHVRSVNESYEEQLDVLACPVTLVWGDDDATVPPSVAEAALDRLGRSPHAPAADLVLLRGAGHLVPLTAPADLRAAVERHLPVIADLGQGGGAAVWVAVAAAVLALAPAGARWLRVAQREHYLPGACTRFAQRWWRSEPANVVLVAVAVAGVGLSAEWVLCALAPAAVALVGPLHLALRGRTSRLVLTRRLRSLAAVWLVLQGAVVAVGALLGAPAPFAAAGVVAVPALVDLALYVTAPVERRLGERFVAAAAERLARVAPTVVAITGSYGKTSTKNHVAHLVAGSRSVVATPASFNNRAGLARSVNEHLAEGTDVFVAEMGTYGPGEIRALCRWCPPDIAVLTAVGPVHLERFGSEDAIVAAKAEIAEQAPVVVVNADDPRLEGLASALQSRQPPPTVVRCSAEDEGADVCVRPKGATVAVTVAGERVATEVPLRAGIQPTNLACAVAVALRLGVSPDEVVARIPTLPSVANRLTAQTAASGVYVIDDTFNSNPAGARAALAMLAAAPSDGRRALVTPGMIELGARQAAENEALARAAAEVVTDLVVVGRTNRRALLRGGSGLRPVVVDTRDDAVRWVRGELGAGDAVLYENDLPDQYP